MALLTGDTASGTGGATEYDFVTRATDLTVTAASAATAQVWLQGLSVAYDGLTRISIEGWCQDVSTAATGGVFVNLWDDTSASDLHRLFQVSNSSGTAATTAYGRAFLTPAAGARIYSLRAWRTVGNGTLIATTANDALPAWFRITKA